MDNPNIAFTRYPAYYILSVLMQLQNYRRSDSTSMNFYALDKTISMKAILINLK
jgi:hypothetical protein